MAKLYIGVNNTPKEVKNWYIGINNQPKKVKKAWIGVNNVPKLFYSDRLSGYQEVEYLELKNDGAIDTGITYDQDPRIVLTFKPSVSHGGSLLGNDYWKSQKGFSFEATLDNQSQISSKGYIRIEYGERTLSYIENEEIYGYIDTNSDNIYILDFNKTVNNKACFYLGNSLIKSFNKSNLSNTSYTPKNIVIGGIKYIESSGTTIGSGEVKIYNCKIYTNTNTLIRDFIPCYNKTNVGFYDLVNNTFYSSGLKTNSNIVLGPDVN